MKNTRTFIVPGIPVQKSRPRVGKFGTYTPEKTVNYENLVKVCYTEEHGQEERLQGALVLTARFYFPVPKSYSKKRKERIKEGKELFVKSPDLDNLMKSVADALNDIAYEDDKQIYESHLMKAYTLGNPRAEVTIEEK